MKKILISIIISLLLIQSKNAFSKINAKLFYKDSSITKINGVVITKKLRFNFPDSIESYSNLADTFCSIAIFFEGKVFVFKDINFSILKSSKLIEIKLNNLSNTCCIVSLRQDFIETIISGFVRDYSKNQKFWKNRFKRIKIPNLRKKKYKNYFQDCNKLTIIILS